MRWTLPQVEPGEVATGEEKTGWYYSQFWTLRQYKYKYKYKYKYNKDVFNRCQDAAPLGIIPTATTTTSATATPTTTLSTTMLTCRERCCKQVESLAQIERSNFWPLWSRLLSKTNWCYTFTHLSFSVRLSSLIPHRKQGGTWRSLSSSEKAITSSDNWIPCGQFDQSCLVFCLFPIPISPLLTIGSRSIQKTITKKKLLPFLGWEMHLK